jgi:hypothetical protein
MLKASSQCIAVVHRVCLPYWKQMEEELSSSFDSATIYMSGIGQFSTFW